MLNKSDYAKIVGHCIMPEDKNGDFKVFTNRVGRRISKEDGMSCVIVDGYKLNLPDYKLKAVDAPENV